MMIYGGARARPWPSISGRRRRRRRPQASAEEREKAKHYAERGQHYEKAAQHLSLSGDQSTHATGLRRAVVNRSGQLTPAEGQRMAEWLECPPCISKVGGSNPDLAEY